MSKYTPGPWEIGKPLMRFMHAEISARGYHKDQRLIIAHVDSVDGFKGNSRANAHLIAAAPDLLEACKAAIKWMTEQGNPQDYHAYAACRTAVEKAEGNSLLGEEDSIIMILYYK